jgi:hypothetical protein
MFIAYSFIGKLPAYIIESVHQARLFFKGDIYLITNELESVYLDKLKKYNVIIINYTDVYNIDFINIMQAYYSKFAVIKELVGREELFIRSLERFFLLHNLMQQRKLTDCLFLELDNLIYDDPEKWLESFSIKELAYMYDNTDRCSSGIMYVKNADSLIELLNYLLTFIIYDQGLLNEMTALFRYMTLHESIVQILPTYWKKEGISDIPTKNFGNYGDSIFDSLSIGVYLLGMDVFHTKGKLEIGKRSWWGDIDYTNDTYEWRDDENGRKIPYIYNGEKWLRINNLHVHSKDLKSGLSKFMEELT